MGSSELEYSSSQAFDLVPLIAPLLPRNDEPLPLAVGVVLAELILDVGGVLLGNCRFDSFNETVFGERGDPKSLPN